MAGAAEALTIAPHEALQKISLDEEERLQIVEETVKSLSVPRFPEYKVSSSEFPLFVLLSLIVFRVLLPSVF